MSQMQKFSSFHSYITPEGTVEHGWLIKGPVDFHCLTSDSTTRDLLETVLELSDIVLGESASDDVDQDYVVNETGIDLNGLGTQSPNFKDGYLLFLRDDAHLSNLHSLLAGQTGVPSEDERAVLPIDLNLCQAQTPLL